MLPATSDTYVHSGPLVVCLCAKPMIGRCVRRSTPWLHSVQPQCVCVNSLRVCGNVTDTDPDPTLHDLFDVGDPDTSGFCSWQTAMAWAHVDRLTQRLYSRNNKRPVRGSASCMLYRDSLPRCEVIARASGRKSDATNSSEQQCFLRLPPHVNVISLSLRASASQCLTHAHKSEANTVPSP